MTREAWGNIEEQPFRVDVGTAFSVAMSASVPAHVLCFTTDGRIVLNETVFGGASAIYINGRKYTSDITTGSVTLPMAEKGVDGLMYGADKEKLDGIESGAQVNVVTAIASDDRSVDITDKEDKIHSAAARKWADGIDTTLDKIQKNADAIGELVNSNFSELKGNITNLDSRITSEKAYLEKEIKDTKAELEAADKKIKDDADLRIYEVNQKIASIDEDLNLNGAMISTNTDEITKLKSRLRGDEDSITENTSAIKKIKEEELTALNIQIEQMLTRIETLENQGGQGGSSADVEMIKRLLNLEEIDKEENNTHE